MALVDIGKKFDKDKRAAEAADGGIAATWPGGRNMLAITSKRLVLCKVPSTIGSSQ